MSPEAGVRRLAIVNRGEAAMRCIRAVKALREESGEPLLALAIYTDVDRAAPFVRHADAAVELPAADGPVAAYLDHERLLDALRRLGADAVWPGWGFVAEDPLFAERVTAEGLVFLGPSADVMRVLGDKVAAKRLAESLGCPVTPWSGGVLASEAEARAAAKALGYPLALKAAAGGGGRGIRMLDGPEGLAEAWRAARSEAAAAFGDDRVFAERRLEGGRHVEVQIAGDRFGQVVSLGCRDCSVQRRYQKLIEETPPPGLAPSLLADLESAAVNLAAKVGYSGVGTAEFLVTGDEFAFLEMNPRLQVEHPISEAVTGVDLVQLQIRIARGERLPERGYPQRGAAMEARLCAEDPDAGFAPAPGRVARFDLALGPGVRVDTGIVAGSVVPAAFDSLVAKVIAAGASREEARARLACALADLELVVEGGASNKGLLLELLDTPEFRAGGVDTGWLDRRARRSEDAFAPAALVVAAILAYQRARERTRRNFFDDPAAASVARVPASEGQDIDLAFRGEAYRLRVFAIGSWRYRVHLDGRVVTARLSEERAGAATLEWGGRSLRILHDAGGAGLRIEVEGRPYRFGWQMAGRVRAGAPAVVVAIHAAVGDRVEAGQALAVLEAMKMEIAVDAPISGTLQEVLVGRGQKVAAGDVLLVIEPEASQQASSDGSRIELPDEEDPLSLFLSDDGVDLAAADRADPGLRQAAVSAAGEEIRRVLLGYDADPSRVEALLAFLSVPLPDGLSAGLRAQLALVRREAVLFADVEELFIRSPRASVSGERGPSNQARTRMYVRRMRAGGAGLAQEYLALLRAALAHYGTPDLTGGPETERAVLRLFAAQRSPEPRHHLVIGLLRRLSQLAASGIDLGRDELLADALVRIARMRGLVPDALADLASELRWDLFDAPASEARLADSGRRLEEWLDRVGDEAPAIPEEVLRELAAAPRRVFERVGAWMADLDPRRSAIGRAAQLRRLYAPLVPTYHTSGSLDGVEVDELELPDGRVVLGTAVPASRAAEALRALVRRAEPAVDALELVAWPDGVANVEATARCLRDAFAERGVARSATLTWLPESGEPVHRSFARDAEGVRECPELRGLHPETADRVDLARLANFELEPLPGGEDVHVFHGRSRELPADERIFVLAEVRGRARGGREAELHIPAFERAFVAAARSLRAALAARDERRRLHWNRISVFVGPEVSLGPDAARELARKLFPETRHLGLDRVVVRLRLVDPEDPAAPARPVEVVIADPTGSRMDIAWRDPRRAPLEPASAYERKLMEARRRGLVYPYEIVRMLTGGGVGRDGEPADHALPPGRFEEYDLVPENPEPRAVRVERPYGENESSIVFGVIDTPTAQVPEGMRRVLVLSDPNIGMGSLAAPECDRLVAVIDLAEQLSLPVEWVPVSSGARISMTSGTENLDATARVVRRIVSFTQAGGVIHLVVHGVNVGAQSYFNALATMLPHTRGVLIMTPGASMVLTGRAALEASGSVAAEDEVAIGGYERVMGPNGEAQYQAADLGDAFRILYDHYRYSYVPPGERAPRRLASADPDDRDVCTSTCGPDDESGFATVGEIFDASANPDRKRPFGMRSVMEAVVDRDGGHLERWRAWSGAEMAIVWDAFLGGQPVCLVGIESRNLPRQGYRPTDGPESWTGGTLFPLSSKKVARALNAASGNRPAVVLANLSGFDGSPESMRKLQLEYGAEIARAVVNFRGPLVFVVVSRYHGGAYVVFSKALNDGLHAAALQGSYASVIGGSAAATVVFSREARARTASDPRVAGLLGEERERRESEVLLEKQTELAVEFDAIHTVGRAREVGSLDRILPASELRPFLAEALRGGEASALSKFRGRAGTLVE